MSDYYDLDAYFAWQELHRCPSCDGLGEDYIEDEFNTATGEYGVPWVCKTCDGTGIDPAASFDR